MKVTVSESELAAAPVDVAIVLVSDSKPLLAPGQNAPGRKLKKQASQCCLDRDFTGALFDSLLLPGNQEGGPGHILLVGAGPKADFEPGRLSRTIQAAARLCQRRKLYALALPVSPVAKAFGMQAEETARLMAQAVQWGPYQVKAKRKPSKASKKTSLLFTDPGTSRTQVRKAAQEGAKVGQTFWKVADLANLAGNDATPQKIASVSRALAKEFGMTCTVWGAKELKREKCHALLAVAQGSRQSGRMITLTCPGRQKKAQPLVLVGKTITFDTGGLSLKPPKSMEWMKYDKCGGMAVLAAMAILAQLKPSRPVVGILAAAENMPGGNAIRPGDVIGSRAGKTIEVLNTDAEGRLVLADALAVAAKYKPAAMVDVATLTGAVISALGYNLTGLMGNDDKLLSELEASGQQTGDRVWRLPLLPEFKAVLSSPFADLKNIGAGGAGSSVAGAFLQEFVPKDVPWAHLDVAGTAWLESNKPYAGAGATLAGTDLLVDWVMKHK